METHHDRIGLLDFGRAALGLLPSAIRSLWATLKVYALTPDSHQSIGSILEHQAESVPDKDCLLFEGQRWSYRDFNDWANRIAHVLKTHGVGPGDTVDCCSRTVPPCWPAWRRWPSSAQSPACSTPSSVARC
jgi:non-ribosomal peptide synthetase component F